MKTARVLVLPILLASLAPLVSSTPHPAEAGRAARSKRIAEKPNRSADVRRVSDRKTPGPRSNYRFQIKSNTSDRSQPGGIRTAPAAVVDTFVVASFGFDEAGVPDPQGWVEVDRTAQDTFFHVDDFAGLAGYAPLEGNKSMWCGVRPATTTDVCFWATPPGY